jgi:hypothetical protein
MTVRYIFSRSSIIPSKAKGKVQAPKEKGLGSREGRERDSRKNTDEKRGVINEGTIV